MRKSRIFAGFAGRFISLSLLCACSAPLPVQSAPLQGVPTRYEECLMVEHKILRTFPPRCVTADGKVFVDTATKRLGDQLCVNSCGNGTCEEMVCMGENCPCAETADTCAADCKRQ